MVSAAKTKKRSNQNVIEKRKIKSLSQFIAVLGCLLLFVSGFSVQLLAQRQTPVGEINGKPLYADEFINQINNDSPFMPALEDDKLKEQPSST
ncbi:MAG: hypothetical protein LH472_07830, partial [Pyrinomonadaceae bacterium]|nr:hypothetical protein [Pyrinomonadaceae bacterium]